MIFDAIKLHCTDNNKWVDAKIVDHTDSWLVVLVQPGDLKVSLKRTKTNLYVGQLHGYEFVYDLNNT